MYRIRAYDCQAATSCRRLHLPRATPWTRVGVESGSIFSRHRSPRPCNAPITPRCAPTSDGELHPEQRETELGVAQRGFEPLMNHQGSISSCDLVSGCGVPSAQLRGTRALRFKLQELEETASTSACRPVAQSAQPPSVPLHRKGRISDANLLRRASLRTLRLVQRPESRHRFQSLFGRRLETPTTSRRCTWRTQPRAHELRAFLVSFFLPLQAMKHTLKG